MLTPGTGQTTADAIALAARGLDPSQPLTLLRHLGEDDCYVRGPEVGGTLIIVPGVWTGMPAELLATMRARRACAATGRCGMCHAVVTLAEGAIDHDLDCPIADENLAPVLGRWVRQVGRYARGRRIAEDPV